jgi:hypothetical protein
MCIFTDFYICVNVLYKLQTVCIDAMKTEATRIPDELAADLDRIATTNRMSKGRVLELALARLVEEVRLTGRLPLPEVKLDQSAVAVV